MAAQDTPPPGFDNVPAINVAQASGDGADEPPSGFNDPQYSSIAQKGFSALEGAASSATSGFSTALETSPLKIFTEALSPTTAGITSSLAPVLPNGPIDPKDIIGRKEANPYTYAAGQGAGLLASALLPGAGAAGLLEQVAKPVASIIENRVLSAAAKGAIETAMVQSGDEISKNFAQDPHQTLGSAAVNVGLSGVLGGVLSGAVGAVSPLWKSKFGTSTTNALNDVINETGGNVETALAGDELRAASPSPEVTAYDPYSGGQYGDHLRNALNSTKPNALEIQQAMERNGLKAGADALSDSELVQRTRDSLAKSSSVAGYAYNKELDGIYKGTQDMANFALRDASTQSRYEAGEQIKSALLKDLNEEATSIQSGYKELQPMLEQVQVSPELKQTAAEAVLNNKFANIAPELRAQSEKLATQIQNVKSVDDVKLLRSYVNNELDKALPKIGAPDTNRANILLEAKKGLNQIREGALSEAEANTRINDESGSLVNSESLQKLKDLDSRWAAHKQDLLELGNQAGLGKPSSTRTLANKLEQIPSEQLTKKFLDAQDVNSLRYLKENFPVQFEVARKIKLQEIKDAATSLAKGKNKQLNVGSFLEQIKDSKIGPEARQLIFDKTDPQLFKDIETIYTGALPENYNPSGTGSAINFAHLFSPEGLVQNASDAVKYTVLKGLPHLQEALGGGTRQAIEIAAQQAARSGQPLSGSGFKALVDYVQSTIKGESAISNAAKSIFDSGKIVLPEILPTPDLRKKLSDRVSELQNDPNSLMNVGGETGHYAPEHGSAIAQTSANAVNYLNSIRPQVSQANPLDSKLKPNPIKQAEFDRALDIAQQPLLALKGIKDGRVVPTDLKHLTSLYPGLYQNLQAKLHQGIVDSVQAGKPIPYKTRLGLSTFLGQPLDSTMTPQAIQANQSKVQNSPQQAQGLPKGAGSGAGPHSYKALDKLPGSFQTPLQARESHRGGRS